MIDFCKKEPKSYVEAKCVLKWEEAMKEEILVLNKNYTWELVLK